MKALAGVLAVAVVSTPAFSQKSTVPLRIQGAANPAPARTPANVQMASVLNVAVVPASPELVTNSSIVEMKRAGMSDDLILSTIHTQPSHFAVGLNDMLTLKSAGVSDAVIVAMQQATANEANAPAPPAAGPAESPDVKPRVYLLSSSHGNTWWAVRDQTMELTKDFERDCPAVRVTVNQSAADYSVALNHIEVGGFVRNNQMEVSDRAGDVIGRTSDGSSIAKGVKHACSQIAANWSSRASGPASPQLSGGH